MPGLREVGALPEDTSRGVEAVKVPETRNAGSRYLGRLGGDLFFLCFPSTFSSFGRSRDPSWRQRVCELHIVINFRADFFFEKVKK